MWCSLCDPTFSRFSRTPTCDGRTDTGPWLVPRMHSMIASRGKIGGNGCKYVFTAYASRRRRVRCSGICVDQRCQFFSTPALRRRGGLMFCWCLMKYTVSQNKKLSYRRVTARCVLSVVILPITTQQCRNYLYDKS